MNFVITLTLIQTIICFALSHAMSNSTTDTGLWFVVNSEGNVIATNQKTSKGLLKGDDDARTIGIKALSKAIERDTAILYCVDDGLYGPRPVRIANPKKEVTDYIISNKVTKEEAITSFWNLGWTAYDVPTTGTPKHWQKKEKKDP